jgi:hypothetical protein
MKIPSKIAVRGGQSATVPATMWNELIDYLRSTRISPSVGVRPIVTSQGTVLVAPKYRSGKSATILHPFKIATFGVSGNDGQITGYKATVTPGTINLTLADNHFDADKLREFSYSKDTTSYVYLKCSITAEGSITSCQIETSNSVRQPEQSAKAAPPTTINALIGVVYNDAVYQAVTTNLTAKLQTTSIADKNAGPGVYPFDIYLNWTVGV